MATFSIDPEQVDPMHARSVLASDASSGFVSGRQTNTAVSSASSQAELQSWELSWEYASASDWSTVEGYWNSTKGGAQSMTWTPPGGSSLTVRMTDFSATSNAEASGYRMRVVLEEIL